MKQTQGVCGVDHIHGWIGCRNKPSCYDDDGEWYSPDDFEEEDQ